MKNNKVLWIIDHYASEPKHGGYTRQYSLAKEISGRGIDVVVLASAFCHFTHRYISEEEVTVGSISDHARIIYFRTNSYESNAGAQRLLGMRAFVREILKHADVVEAQFGRPDWVVASSPHIFSWVAGEKIAAKYRASFNIEIRDFWPLELRSDSDDLMHRALYAWFDHLETKAFRRAETIICTTDHGADYCDDMKKPGREKFIHIGQPLDCDRYDREAEENYGDVPAEIREFTGNDFYCVFSGYYMPYEGVMLMLDAAEELRDIKFVFVGSGQEETNMRKRVAERGLDNVLIWNRIPKECIPALLKRSGVCLAYLYDENNPNMFKYGMSKNKVSEYLYSGAVTVMGFNIDGNEITASGGGYTFRPDGNRFAEYIRKVADMSPEERKAMGDKAREYMRREHGTAEIAEKYIRCVLKPD